MKGEVINIGEMIGDNAGRLWHYLAKKKAQTPAAAAKALNMRSAEIDRAIGWLAREDKLTFQKDKRGTLRMSLK